MGIFGDWLGLAGGMMANRQNAKAARQNKKDQIGLIDKLDWDPMYASDTTPMYKPTQSPVARAYLESMLTGSNPDTTYSTRPNAAATKATQQASQNAMYGTPEERVAQQRALQSQPLYTVPTPTRSVTGGTTNAPSASQANAQRLLDRLAGRAPTSTPQTSATTGKNQPGETGWQALNPRYAEMGIDQGEADQLVAHGLASKGSDFSARVAGDNQKSGYFTADNGLLDKMVQAQDWDGIRAIQNYEQMMRSPNASTTDPLVLSRQAAAAQAARKKYGG